MLVPEEGRLRIAREEMLRSEIVGAARSTERLSPARFAFVDSVGAPSLVLHDAPEDAWATGPVELVSRHPAVARRRAKVSRLPKSLRAWVGREVILHTAAGGTCKGAVRELWVATRFWPHFGMSQRWSGDPGVPPMAERPTRPMEDEAVARDAWKLGSGARVLLGRVAVDVACKDPLWAHATDHRPAGPILTAAPATADLRRRALQRLRALKGVREVQEAYAAGDEVPRAVHWTRHDGVEPKVVVLSGAGGPRIVAASASAGPGCGGFYGEMWAAWEIKEGGDESSLVLLTDEREPGELFLPRLGVDLDGDGRFELIGGDALVRPVGPVLRRTQDAEIPSYECPC